MKRRLDSKTVENGGWAEGLGGGAGRKGLGGGETGMGDGERRREGLLGL